MKNIVGFVGFLALLVPACGGGEDGGGADAGASAELVCSASNPCPSGQFCWNGLCAIGCNSNSDCAEDQYCDTEFDRLCHNKTVATCPDTPCAEGQVCQNGLCSTPPASTSCTPRVDGNDGCDEYSLCIEGESEGDTACYSFPACDAQGSCPVGTIGAVCNNDIVPNKARMCLSGLCQAPGHCPSSWSCVKQTTDVVGVCSDGQFGSLCLGNQDCQAGLSCVQGLPGSFGICQPGL